MNKKKKIITMLCVTAIMIATLMGIRYAEITNADTNVYEDAKAFYDYIVAKDSNNLCEFADMNYYYVTKAKKASSINKLRYVTVGWRITAGNKYYIDVKRESSIAGKAAYLVNVDSESLIGNYYYNLYKISYEDISMLMYEKYGQEWVDFTNEKTSFRIHFDAIMSYKPKGSDTPAGYISDEDGKGGVTFVNRDKCYYLVEGTDEYEAFCDKFNRDFAGYYDIGERLTNSLLTLQYKVGDNDSLGITLPQTTENRTNSLYIKKEDGLIYDNETKQPFVQQMRRFSYMPAENKELNVKSVKEYFGLKRTGYHVNIEKEWEKEESPGSYVSSGGSYLASALDITSAKEDVTLTLVANWIPNTYKVHYDADGGKGTIPDTVLTYDAEGKLTTSLYEKAGYEIDPNEAWIDENGNKYAQGDIVSNLTTINNGVITLKANWKPIQIEITTDKQGCSDGTDRWYQWYGIGNFSDAGCTIPISAISLPNLKGHTFNGYWTSANGNGTEAVKSDGTITNAYFFQDTIVYAHWTKNTYKITLDNQGADIIDGTAAYYEKYKIGNYRDKNCTETISNITVPQKMGYTFGGYYTEKDGHGDAYVSTSGKITSDAEIFAKDTTLYAYWIPNVYEITLDMQDGSGGTTHFFEKYGVGFYSDRDCTNAVTTITIPLKVGNNFKGYWTMPRNSGTELIGYSGSSTTMSIGLNNKKFTSNATLYAFWEETRYTITFDKQGGIGGTSYTTVAYGETYPMAVKLSRGTYTFYGYYTEKNGGGTLIYDKYMNTSQKYTLTTDQTLYAYWVDETAPTINLLVDYDTWTNQEVTLTANAQDFGSGLAKVEIYLMNDDGSIGSSPVATSGDLNGVNEGQLTFVNKTEGVIRYKAIATDVQGLKSESVNVVYYDITPPSGTLISGGKDGNVFEFEFDITDINPGN